MRSSSNVCKQGWWKKMFWRAPPSLSSCQSETHILLILGNAGYGHALTDCQLSPAPSSWMNQATCCSFLFFFYSLYSFIFKNTHLPTLCFLCDNTSSRGEAEESPCTNTWCLPTACTADFLPWGSCQHREKGPITIGYLQGWANCIFMACLKPHFILIFTCSPDPRPRLTTSLIGNEDCPLVARNVKITSDKKPVLLLLLLCVLNFVNFCSRLGCSDHRWACPEIKPDFMMLLDSKHQQQKKCRELPILPG